MSNGSDFDHDDGYLGVEAALPAAVSSDTLDRSAFAIDIAIRSHPEHPMHGWDGVAWNGSGEIPDGPRAGFAICRCGARLPVRAG